MDNRIPKNYEGLLRFCTEQTALEDPTRPSEFSPLSNEKREFLQNVFNSLAENDPIKRMIEIVKKLMQDLHLHSDVKLDTTVNDVDVSNPTFNSVENPAHINFDEKFIDEKESLIQDLIDYCENIDLANDFHKIGGFSILLPLLNSKISTLKSLACELIATLTQNNPYGQQAILNENIVPYLVHLLSSQSDNNQVKIKAMYAVSCLCRFNEPLQEELLRLNMLPQLLYLINSDILKLQIKSAFLIGSLAEENTKIKNHLRRIQSCAIISEALLKSTSDDLKEQLLYAMSRIIKKTEGPTAIDDDLNLDKLVKNKNQLLEFLQSERAKLKEDSSNAYRDNLNEIEALLKI